jgi:PmbA protein
MEEILARASKVADEAEVFMVATDETSVQFETNRLKHIQSKQASSLALRIAWQGKAGYATTTQPSNGQELVDMALETARFGTPVKFEFPPASIYPTVDVFDPGVAQIPLETMVGLGEELIATITGHTPEIICEGGVTKAVVSVRIINSRGGETSYRKSISSLGIEGSLIRGTDMLFVGDSESSCHPVATASTVADAVLQQLEWAKEQAPVATAELSVIFTPNGIASALIAPLMAAFNGKTVLEGASPIGKRQGETVFDRQLSMWDDPTVAYHPASRPSDDEGVPSQRTSLIEQGTVANFLYDLQTAALANTRSTGNGGRSRGLPVPTPTAFIVAPGHTTFEEMVSDIKEGLVIEQLMGAGQGNVLGGDFSGNVLLGYKVENGKIVGRVKDTMVSGNIYQVLNGIAAIGSDPRWVGGFLQTPSIYCPKVSVASK